MTKSSKDKVSPQSPAAKKSYFTLFRYATTFDVVLMILGCVGAAITGVSQPLMAIVFGTVMQSLSAFPKDATQLQKDALEKDVGTGVIYLTIIGAVVGLTAYLQMAAWLWAEAYLKAVLSQDVAWFDATQSGEITTRMTGDIVTIQDGISDKVGLVVQATTTFLSGFVIAFTKGWRLALVLCSVFPLLGGAMLTFGKVLAARKEGGAGKYAEAGAIAQEVLSSIRTVTAFGGQNREIARYTAKLEEAKVAGIKGAFYNGLSTGIVFLIIFFTYALGFWYGGQLIPDPMSGGDVITTFFSIIIGAFSLGISAAVGVAPKVFETIDRVSPIDPFSESGLKPESCSGEIQFKDVSFTYPQRPDVPILKSFSLSVKSGQTVALVGASGSGKSTIVKLLERFYNPISGDITLDNISLPELNVTWLRDQLGIVSQEPILFDYSVKYNLLLGLKSTQNFNQDSTEYDSLIETACKTANAWEFINSLPNGMQTIVGEAGAMMSGGQKQRIAIARALMRDPTILLLDEATSALDTDSERIVQAALDNAARNRTTIVIAHRLSTVKNADLIVVVDKGEIVEVGKHDELVSKEGAYARLVNTQALREAEKSGSSENMKNQPSEKETLKKVGNEVVLKLAEKPDVLKMTPVSKQLDSKKDEEAKKEAEKARLKKSISFFKLYNMNRSEWGILLTGAVFSAGNGCIFPIFSLIINVFFEADKEKRLAGINFWAIMFVVIGTSAFIVNFVSIWCFGTAGEKLTRTIQMAFFDEDGHSSGVLTGRLSEDAFLVQGLVGASMATVVQISASMISGLVIAFLHGWQLTLIVLCTVPFIGLAGQMQITLMTGFGSKSKEAYEHASTIANEAVDQIRTVLTLTREKMFLQTYKENTVEPHKIAVKGGVVASIGYALSQAVIFLAYALAFYAGSRLALAEIMEGSKVLIVMFAVIFTAISLGQATSLAPNYVKAKLAALDIFELLDRNSRINPTWKEGRTVAPEDLKGDLSLVDTKFEYPSRPGVPVLQGLSIAAEPGQTVALVGPSGCGKSTVIAILERWYDLHSGYSTIDGIKTLDWNITDMRSHLALVGQEPVLFNLSIKENIAYGAIDGECTMEDIEAAAKKANIHDFVSSLPEGYDTLVGSKGGQLSGGQKQRVAIARALIRNPKILLLDEATSALDSESEKVVQEALDAAAKGRTTIVIAHRLSTIQNADLIIVVNKGKVAEKGKYNELVKAGGQFAELVAAQSLSKN